MASRSAQVALALAVMSAACAVVYVRHSSRETFVELQALQRERDRLNVEWGQWLIEQGTMSMHARVEELAGTRLGMAMPAPDQVVLVPYRGDKP